MRTVAAIGFVGSVLAIHLHVAPVRRHDAAAVATPKLALRTLRPITALLVRRVCAVDLSVAAPRHGDAASARGCALELARCAGARGAEFVAGVAAVVVAVAQPTLLHASPVVAVELGRAAVGRSCEQTRNKRKKPTETEPLNTQTGNRVEKYQTRTCT